MKINSGPWKPDVPSRSLASIASPHDTLKYDFLFALKIWNLIVWEIAMCCAGKWPLCSVSLSAGTNPESQSDRPLIPDWQPGRGPQYTCTDNGPGILVTALATQVTLRPQPGCGERIMRVGRCYATIIVCGHGSLGLLVPGCTHWAHSHCSRNGIYQAPKTNLEMSKARQLFPNVRKVRRKMLMAHNWRVLELEYFSVFVSGRGRGGEWQRSSAKLSPQCVRSCQRVSENVKISSLELRSFSRETLSQNYLSTFLRTYNPWGIILSLQIFSF